MVYQFRRGLNKHCYKDEVYDVDFMYPELVWEEVVQWETTKLMHRIWRYTRDTQPCLACETSNNMVYLIEPKGVIGRCVGCGCTFPVPPIELDPSGNMIEHTRAELLDSRIVTTAEAAKICERIGQVMPNVPSSDRQTYNKTKRPIPKSMEELAKSAQDSFK